MKKISVGLLELKTAVLECFLEKTPLSPLGVKEITIGSSSYLVGNQPQILTGPHSMGFRR
jgi:hypothetical protein